MRASPTQGDYQFEACGAFCKEAKKGNHCKFCKCKACTFCAAGGSSAAPPALSPRRSPPPPRWPKNRKKAKLSGATAVGGAGKAVGGAGKEQCASGIKGDLPFMTCAGFCKSSKATNHCKFCKCRTCAYCTKEGTAAEGAVAAGAQPSAAVSVPKSEPALATTGGVPQRGVGVDRVASTGASHARIFQGLGVAILLVLLGLGLVAFTSQGDATVGTFRHTMQTHLAKMGLASHGVEGNRLTAGREEATSDLDAAFAKVDQLEGKR